MADKRRFRIVVPHSNAPNIYIGIYIVQIHHDIHRSQTTDVDDKGNVIIPARILAVQFGCWFGSVFELTSNGKLRTVRLSLQLFNWLVFGFFL